MDTYSQSGQPLRVMTDLPEDTLLLEGLNGEEAVSEPFLFTLDLLSEDPDVDGDALLRSAMHVEVELADGGTRLIHGLVRRFSQVGWDQDLIHYRVELVPWLWFLSLGRDSRIFQEMDVLAIMEEVFDTAGYSDFEIRCARSYEAREFTVQYRESDLNFVSRLLEEEGIFYFFEHSDSGHVLVLADDTSAFEECEGGSPARMHTQAVPDEDVVTEFVREHSVHPGKVTLADYDYLQPSLTLRSEVAGDEPEEVYDHPGRFDDLDAGDHLARLALEREEGRRQMVRGAGTCRAFVSGTRFELQDHMWRDANQEWVLLRLRHRATNGSYRAGRGAEHFDYRNEFVAIPHSVPYRPDRKTRKPSVQGAQTAEVVGPGGEQIWVDEHGRVKIHFHWDRLGGRDENSSCWVRVSQNWAGKRWGGMFIPHIGQEVIVDFLEGDPDRPIITGRVYNAENTPPQDLPANQHKSIIEDDFGNEMVFDATPGDEHIRIHSPSHQSLMEIGKSFKMFTDSDWSRFIDGNDGEVNLGTKLGGFIGFKGDLELGGSLKVFAGFKVDFSLSEDFKISFGPSVSASVGKEYKIGKASFEHHVGESATLKSDEKVLVIGGKDKTSIMEAKTEGLTLQYGDTTGTHTVRSQATPIAAVSLTTILGLAGAVGGAAAWDYRSEEDGVSDAVYAGIMGLTAPALAAVATIVDVVTSNSRSPVPMSIDTVHGPQKHAMVRLFDRGVLMHAFPSNSTSPNAALALRNWDGGILAGLGKHAVRWVSSDGDIQLLAPKGKVEVKAKEGVDFTCSGVVKFKSRAQIQIG